MRTYQPIWERIRANPGKRVPIEVPSIYLSRLLKAVKKEKTEDVTYKNVRTAQNKTGILYKSTAPHLTRPGYLVCTFILREFLVVLSDRDRHAVVGFGGFSANSITSEELLKEIDMVSFDFIPSNTDIIAAKMQLGTEIQNMNNKDIQELKDSRAELITTAPAVQNHQDQLKQMQERIRNANLIGNSGQGNG